MDFLRFYALVIREASRHSLGATQGILFLLLILAGAVASQNPATKPMVESLDLGGWKVAAIIFVSIIAIRLVLAPYWLWRTAQSRSVMAPERSIDYKLVVTAITNRKDIRAKAIQIIFVLHNGSYFHSLRYEVEEVYAEVDGNTVEGEIVWANKGEIIPPAAKYNFDYPWIHLKSRKWIKPGTEGHVRIVYKYGTAGQPFSRRVTYASPIVIEKSYIRSNPTENRDEAL